MATVSIQTEALRRAIRSALTRVPVAAKRALTRAGAFHVREMAERFVPYGSGSAAGFGGSIQTRSGILRRTFGFAVEDDGAGARVVMFSAGVKYAKMQEFGGTIFPRKRQFLTVPLPPALTPAGVLKGGARLVKRGENYYTADGDRTVLFTGRSGAKIIARETGDGRNRRLTPLYVLRKSVTLRPRLGFVRTFSDKTEPFFRSELSTAINEAFQ